MSDLLVSIGVIFVLLLVGFLFSAAEMALVTLRDSQIQRRATEQSPLSPRSSRLLELIANTAIGWCGR